MPVLQQRIQYYAAARVACALLEAMYGTWRMVTIDPEPAIPGIFHGPRPGIVTFWHRHIIAMLTHFRGAHVTVPVSEHRDGEYVAQAMERFRLDSVRGSSTHGGSRLLRDMMGRIREGWSPALTPDGPRGPRFSVQPGFTLLARRSGLPVYPFGLAEEKAWVLKSWDAFVVPKPFSHVAVCLGPALRAADYSTTAEFCDALRRGTLRGRQTGGAGARRQARLYASRAVSAIPRTISTTTSRHIPTTPPKMMTAAGPLWPNCFITTLAATSSSIAA